MLMHVSLTATVLTLTPQTTGIHLLAYGLAFAAAVWLVIAAAAIANRRLPGRQALRRRVA
jgi:hypothetical protein